MSLYYVQNLHRRSPKQIKNTILGTAGKRCLKRFSKSYFRSNVFVLYASELVKMFQISLFNAGVPENMLPEKVCEISFRLWCGQSVHSPKFSFERYFRQKIFPGRVFSDTPWIFMWNLSWLEVFSISSPLKPASPLNLYGHSLCGHSVSMMESKRGAKSKLGVNESLFTYEIPAADDRLRCLASKRLFNSN